MVYNEGKSIYRFDYKYHTYCSDRNLRVWDKINNNSLSKFVSAKELPSHILSVIFILAFFNFLIV